MKKAIFHIHTKYSYDSVMEPKDIVDFCVKNNIYYLFITDHDTIRGSLEAREYAKKNNLPVEVIIGAEYLSDIGDLIGIFLKEEIKVREYKKLIKEIKSQGGLVVLPHPFRGHDLFKIFFLDEVDFIEVFNARVSSKYDFYARELKEYKGFKEIYGSDAHLYSELGNVVFEFEGLESFMKGKINLIKANKTKNYKIKFSQVIKGLKQKDFNQIILNLGSAFFNFILQK